jgi:O-antigen ligase
MVFAALLTLVAVLRYYEVLDIKTPMPQKTSLDGGPKGSEDASDGAFVQEQEYDPEKGELVTVNRLRGTGIFQDPNDLSMALALGFVLALYLLLDPDRGIFRLAALPPMGLFLFAFALTSSRGGFLCLLAGVLAALYAHLGWRKMLAVSAVGVPAVLVLFAGRMTSLSATEGTGQTRIQIWSDGLQLVRESPIFGVGMEQFAEHAYKVAHNSFLHCYAELGVFGGTLFLGLFYFAVVMLYRLGRAAPGVVTASCPDDRIQALPEGAGAAGVLEPLLLRMQPFLMGVVVSYIVGMLSLSRSYVVPTYLVLGLVTAYTNLCTAPAAAPVLRVEPRVAQRLAFASALCLAAFYVVVRVFRT